LKGKGNQEIGAKNFFTDK